MIKIDENTFEFEGELGIILAEISFLVLRLLENDVKYDLIQMAVKHGFEYYLKEEE